MNSIQSQEQHSVAAMDISPSLDSPSLKKLLVVDGAAAATNLGVRSVAHGDLNEAMQLFREALIAIKSAFPSADMHASSSISRETLDQAACRVAQAEHYAATPKDSSSFLMCMNSPTPALDSSTAKTAVPCPSSSETIFSYPFTIHSPCRREDADEVYYFCSDVDVDSSLFSAVIIYNMAVTTHKMANLEPPGRRKSALRQRTNSLYDMCHQLLSNTSEQVEGTSTSTSTSQSTSSIIEVTSVGRAMFDLMCMAIVNNKAELYSSDTLDYQLSLLHMDQLVELATSVRNQSYGDDTLDTTVHTAVQFFLANAYQSKLCVFCAAPAA